mmetsp:Transcript_9676/g.30640  ORF Transcript_9676/g.30640 Transcript_9676/m.30640 type:complete len:377 (+) Transcript_9676:1829-2959(+)
MVRLPVHHAEEAHVQLGPRARVDATTVRVDEDAALDHRRIVARHAEETQRNVAHARAEHGRGRFDVHAPTAVQLLVHAQVVRHRLLEVGREHLGGAAGHVPHNNETGHQEVRPAVVARPVAVVGLQHVVPRHRLAHGLADRARLPRRVGHGLAGGAPCVDALLSPERVGRVWVLLRVEARRRLALARSRPVPNLPAGRLAGELAALEEGRGHTVRLLGDRAAPARIQVVRLVRPLRLAQDAVRARAARVRCVHARKVVARERAARREREQHAGGREQREEERVRREDARRREQGPLATRVVVPEHDRAVAGAAVLPNLGERHGGEHVPKEHDGGGREGERLSADRHRLGHGRGDHPRARARARRVDCGERARQGRH